MPPLSDLATLPDVPAPTQVVRLTGLQAVAPEIDEIRTMSRTAQGPAACYAMQTALQQLNRCDLERVEAHFIT